MIGLSTAIICYSLLEPLDKRGDVPDYDGCVAKSESESLTEFKVK